MPYQRLIQILLTVTAVALLLVFPAYTIGRSFLDQFVQAGNAVAREKR
jgi:hypothetical protein